MDYSSNTSHMNPTESANAKKETDIETIEKKIGEILHDNEDNEGNPLNSTWVLWSHENNDKNWNLSSYSKISNISTIQEFWSTYNNFELVGGLTCRDYFLMRQGVNPMWEDPYNRNGKTWSIQVPTNLGLQLWTLLSMSVTGEYFSPDSPIITGVSISPKDNCFIIKIWVSCTNKDITNSFREFVDKRYRSQRLSIKSKVNKPEYA
jgi:hypothetical protein